MHSAVTRAQLEQLIASVGREEEPKRQPRQGSNGRGGQFERFDLAAYLNKYGVQVKTVKEHGGSTLHVLDNCLFDPSHSGGEAAIGQTAEGKLFYQCFHDS